MKRWEFEKQQQFETVNSERILFLGVACRREPPVRDLVYLQILKYSRVTYKVKKRERKERVGKKKHCSDACRRARIKICKPNSPA